MSRARPSQATARAFLAMLVPVLFLIGCATTNPPPEPRYYRLPPVTPCACTDGPLAATLSVDRFHAAGPYAERPIVYVEAGTPLTLRSYHYHLWALPPPELLQESLLSWLRGSGLAERVTRSPGASGAGQVTGRVLRLERESAPDGAMAVVELELGYRPATGGGEEWSRIYQASAQPATDDMHALVEAFGVALDESYSRYVADLSVHLRKRE